MPDLVEPDDREKAWENYKGSDLMNPRAAFDAAWGAATARSEARVGDALAALDREERQSRYLASCADGAVAGTERERALEAERDKERAKVLALQKNAGEGEVLRRAAAARHRAEKAEAQVRALTDALTEAEGELRRIAAVVDAETDAPLLLATADRARAALPVPDEAPTPRAYPARGEKWRHRSTGVYEVVCVRRDGLYAVEEEGACHFLRMDYFLDHFTPVPGEGEADR